jgi:hypothetical protein
MAASSGSVRGFFGLARRALARRFGQLAGLATAAPVALALVEVLARPWAESAWLDVWRRALVAGPGLGVALWLVGMVVAATRADRLGVARVEGDELVVDRGDGDVRRVPVASLRGGLVVPAVHGRRARVEIDLASGDALVGEIDDVAEGERLLDALGLGPSRRRAVVPLRSPARASLRRGLAVVAMVLASFMALGFLLDVVEPLGKVWVPVWLFATAAAAFLAARVARPKSVTIGADGVVVPGFVRDRFVPFAAVAAVQATTTSVVFVAPKTGERRERRRACAADPDAARAVSLRVERAMAEARGEGPSAKRLESLAREGRTVAAWREAASRAASGGDYRATTLSADDLAALLTAPDASAEHRVGAAFALAAAGEPERARVRVAAEACASPKLRVALEAIAAGDAEEAAVEDALAGEAPAAKA